ncbi:MAG: hypothetical protein HUK00_04685 [Bacteroidaceae bacterium]|nr:hypothetical protein [Bacteroidaceae bacterium]
MNKTSISASSTKMPYLAPDTAHQRIFLTQMVCGSLASKANPKTESEVAVKDLLREDLYTNGGIGDGDKF